jgi:lipid A 3-O-deacylase
MRRVAVTTALVCFASLAAADEMPASESWAQSLAPTGVFVQAGRASETTTLTLGLQWDWKRSWRLGERSRLSGYNEISLGHWQADNGGSAVVTQIGFTPTFRWWPAGGTNGWFGELGVGLNLLTPIYRTREKSFSTAFNFGDHLAVGYRPESMHGWEWSLRVQHFSNAGIDHPNPGENFVQLRMLMPLGERGNR